MSNDKIKEETYNALLSERKILINEDITEDLIEKAVMMIFSMNEEDDDCELTEKNFDRNSRPIIMYINTNGGDCYAALSLVSAMESSKTPIITVALGKCMSAGMLILLAGMKRLCQKYSTLMYHQVSAGVIGSLGDMKSKTDEVERLQKLIDKIFVDQTKIEKEDLIDKYISSDWYITPREATKLGIIDGVI